VATDVAARGIDVDDVDVVVQLGCRHVDSYVHRAGRTGRKGKEGMNVLFFTRDSYEFIMKLERMLHLNIEVTNHLGHHREESITHLLNAQVEEFEPEKAYEKETKEVLNMIEGMPSANRQRVLEFLVQYYLDDNSLNASYASLLSGSQGKKTYEIEASERMTMHDVRNLREQRLKVYNYRDQGRMNVVFDANEEELAMARKILGNKVEMKEINRLPDYVKEIFLKFY